MFIGGEECVTVKQLIEHLQQFPEDTPCVFSQFSDFSALMLDEIRLHRPEDKKLVYRNGGIRSIGTYKQWGDEQPQFITVVTFPGN